MARLLDSVIGHAHLIESFLEAFANERLPNTFLFVGHSGIGKRTTAEALAQALLCETSFKACGLCASCLRAAKGQHESFRFVKPEKNLIKIEQSRDILDFLSLQALTKRRVVIFDEAEKLNPQAGNALLKILEEPNINTFFFLIAPSPSHVLPTLRSRSQIVSFKPLTAEELRQKSHNAPEWTVRAAQGSFERLKSFSDSEELETREMAVQFLKSWNLEPQGYLHSHFREYFRDRAAALSLSKYISLLLRDAVGWQIGERQNLMNPDQEPLFQELSIRSPEQLMETTQRAFRLERELAMNRDGQLLFEEFWIHTKSL